MPNPDTPPSRASRRPLRGFVEPWIVRLVVVLFVSIGTSSIVVGQDKPAADKAEGLFDDEEKKKDEKAPDSKKGADSPKAETVSDRDTIGFTQENVASQMTELEERMFRLSEALRSLEPENASRLTLALKFSREELILHQMKQTQSLLKEAQLSKAETEARELLAKLEHLRNLLLAEDLDFQMKLARLRQMRDALNQLDRIIKEEKRELTWSRMATDAQKDLATLKKHQTGLEQLVRDQKAVIGETKDSSGKEGDAAKKAARVAARERETGVRTGTEALAGEAFFAGLQPPFLKQAGPHLG
ncbi:hypothetical protein ACYOEI_28300, partial [Singulisphaera rosea]